MIYAFLSIVVIVVGALYAMHVYLNHVKASFHNTELDKLLERMDAWDKEAVLIRTTAAEVNDKLTQVKNMVVLTKRSGG
jgi:hypothetical protein